MVNGITTLEQRQVMVQIEELIQSNPDYSGVREELESLQFIPQTDTPDYAIWVQPDLQILVMLRINLGGGYSGYRVASFEELAPVER
ncbi:hypothetical protein FGU65_04070 [Methanoculleus sp. FWC-SCC1]|uniref:Uncharacterized protein n=1 Tax=Methanoculleus frigidifontis TaxID=2584085 RepID=A0ABT8M816_9EURY|nr:hypothetical protein [Methanoculleus sp. FWC-SCC1]MDN7024073.1 hypothetical protein [Methanoculleus sp. FWC-SCC1]